MNLVKKIFWFGSYSHNGDFVIEEQNWCKATTLHQLSQYFRATVAFLPGEGDAQKSTTVNPFFTMSLYFLMI